MYLWHAYFYENTHVYVMCLHIVCFLYSAVVNNKGTLARDKSKALKNSKKQVLATRMFARVSIPGFVPWWTVCCCDRQHMYLPLTTIWQMEAKGVAIITDSDTHTANPVSADNDPIFGTRVFQGMSCSSLCLSLPPSSVSASSTCALVVFTCYCISWSRAFIRIWARTVRGVCQDLRFQHTSLAGAEVLAVLFPRLSWLLFHDIKYLIFQQYNLPPEQVLTTTSLP